MQVKDQEMAKHGTRNAKQEQEIVVSRDHAAQTRAGAKASLEKARKQKEKQKKSDK
ncbi:MAG: hypothetical protein ABI389_13330 [Rhodanobacter sp.]